MGRSSTAILISRGERVPTRSSWSFVLSVLCVASTIFGVACGRDLPVSEPEATPAARKVLGLGQDYVPERLSAADVDLIKRSILARRQFAWAAVAKALAPVATNAGGFVVPTWASWYARDDFQRIFHQLYDGLGRDGRRGRRAFGDEAIGAAESWNARMVDGLPNWPSDRYAAWLATVDSQDRAQALTGLNRTLLSPEAMRHMLRNYRSMNDCIDIVGDVPFGEPGLTPDNFSRCYDREFQPAAALVKTAWSRDAFDFSVGTYDTSAQGLARRLANPIGTWESPEGVADPDEASIYTIELDQGSRFRLAGMHLMTKELREWVWITLWWSDTPDQDFGEDRPASIRALGGPWSNYKMCVAVAFDGDGAVDDPIDAELRERFPSLAASLESAQAAVGDSSWCSNPFIEAGPGNQRSNCIGCHQHAGSTLDPRLILTDEARFPKQGRARIRENFPADYLWSFGKDPERWASYIRGQITHYDTFDSVDEHLGGTR